MLPADHIARCIERTPHVDSLVTAANGQCYASVRQANGGDYHWDLIAWRPGEETAQPLVCDGSANREPTVSPDCRWLAYVSERDGRHSLRLRDLATAKTQRLDEAETAIAAPAIGRSGQQVLYTKRIEPQPGHWPSSRWPAPRATRRIDYKRNAQGWVGDLRAQLFSVTPGELPIQLTTVAHEHRLPAWHPSGERLGVVRYDWARDTAQLLVLERDGSVLATLGHACGQVRCWSWSPDGTRLVYAGTDSWDPQPDLYLVVGSRTHRLTEDIPFLPDPTQAPVWLDERRVLFAGAVRGRSGVFIFDLDRGMIGERMCGGVAMAGASGDRSSIQAVSRPGCPVELVEIAHETLEVRARLALAKPAAAARVEQLSIEHSGRQLDGWLWTPHDFDPSARYPLILFAHGGPESFTGPRYELDFELLCAAGYCVLAGNPRGSTSYGRAFAHQVFENWGPGPLADYLALLDTVLARAPFEAGNLGIMGGSYGAYMTAYATSMTDRFRAAAATAITFDLVSQYWGADNDHIFGERGWGGSPLQNPGFYGTQSPHVHAAGFQTPTLLLHGEHDQLTPIGQAEEMFRALLKNGCPAELVIYPGQVHAFRGDGPPEYRADAYARIIGWFDEHLTPTANHRPPVV